MEKGNYNEEGSKISVMSSSFLYINEFSSLFAGNQKFCFIRY